MSLESIATNLTSQIGQFGASMELSGADHPAPVYQLLLGGRDISAAFRPRLIDMTITDKRGMEADTVEVNLDDSDGLLDLPERGVTLQVLIGWRGQQLVDKGTFKIDEVEHSGTPDKLAIRGKSADLTSELNKLKERSFHATTVGAIVEAIAKPLGLKPACAKAIAETAIDHIDQAKEADMSFLTRLGQQCGGVPSVKSGNLLMLAVGSGKTASGKAMPSMTITRRDGDQHHFAVADRDAYTGVTAYWHDAAKAKTQTTTSKRKRKRKATAKPAEEIPTDVVVNKEGREVLAGAEGNVKVLRHIYASRNNAIRGARAEWAKLQRGVAEFELDLARGIPDLIPEMNVTVSGFKKQIDAAAWIPTEVTHRINNGGYTAHIRFEVKTSDLPDVSTSDE